MHTNSSFLSACHLDLYVLFETVRALGGLQTVLRHKYFPHLHPFLFPGDPGCSALQLRACYERTCVPFAQELTDTLEKVYHDKHIHSATPAWVFVRVEIPGGSNLNGINLPTQMTPHGLTANEPGRTDIYPEATRAALRARINTNLLEHYEEDHFLFEDFDDYLVRLDLRNHIIRLWYRNVKQRLSVTDALKDVPHRFHELGVLVYTFLNAVALINYGAIPLTSSDALHFPMKSGRSKKHVAVVGAGISGLVAARQLLSYGFDVTVFEARDRPGGRIFTETEKFSAPVDLGAMVLTGLDQNPVAVLAEQTGSEIYTVNTSCPLFDIDGKWVSDADDKWAELEYNAVLSATARYREKKASKERALSMSLGVAFQRSFKRRMLRRRMLVTRNIRESKKVQSTQNDSIKNLSSNNFGDVGNSENLDPGNISSKVQSTKRKRPRVPLVLDARPEYSGQCKDPNKIDVDVKKVEKGERPTAVKPTPLDTYFKKQKPNLECEKVCTGEGATKAPAVVRKSAAGTPASSPVDLLQCMSKMSHIGRLIRWHIANLEYGCAATISSVSLSHWDQDDPYAFDGAHGLLKTGFGALVTALMEGLYENVKFQREIGSVRWNKTWDRAALDVYDKSANYRKTQEHFDAVLLTVPLGVLKSGSIKFHPSLPKTKRDAIERLGSGGLMKVALEFPEKFWCDSDLFGALREIPEKRGLFYVFWSLFGAIGRPVLLALVIEPLVEDMEKQADSVVVEGAMELLKRAYKDAPDPIVTSVTRWDSDPYARGAYSYIPVGSSGEDYDILAEPVGPSLFFAGEHTCRKNPTTCASGMISGLREASRIAEKFGAVQHMAKLDAKFLEGYFYQRSIDSSSGRKKLHSAGRVQGRRGPSSVSPQT